MTNSRFCAQLVFFCKVYRDSEQIVKVVIKAFGVTGLK